MVSDKRSALIACSKGHVDAARLLLDKGADVDRAKKDGVTPLYIRLPERPRRACATVAGERRGGRIGRGRQRRRCSSPAGTGHVDAARLLLEKGARSIGRMRTPLFYAAAHRLAINGHVDAARLLLEKGAEVDRADEDGADAAVPSPAEGPLDAARLVLDKGAGRGRWIGPDNDTVATPLARSRASMEPRGGAAAGRKGRGGRSAATEKRQTPLCRTQGAGSTRPASRGGIRRRWRQSIVALTNPGKIPTGSR